MPKKSLFRFRNLCDLAVTYLISFCYFEIEHGDLQKSKRKCEVIRKKSKQYSTKENIIYP